jgi:hypothetical protein
MWRKLRMNRGQATGKIAQAVGKVEQSVAVRLSKR